MSPTHPFRTSCGSYSTTTDLKQQKREADADPMQTSQTNFYSVQPNNRNSPKSLKTKIGGES